MTTCSWASYHSKNQKDLRGQGMEKVLETDRLDKARKHQQPTLRHEPNLQVRTIHAQYFLLEEGGWGGKWENWDQMCGDLGAQVSHKVSGSWLGRKEIATVGFLWSKDDLHRVLPGNLVSSSHLKSMHSLSTIIPIILQRTFYRQRIALSSLHIVSFQKEAIISIIHMQKLRLGWNHVTCPR